MNEEKGIKFTVGVLVFLMVLSFIWLVSGPVAVISPGERGVEVRTGKVTGRVYTEGWYLYNSITKNIIQFDTRSQVSTVEVAAASQDLQDVNMEVAIQYSINPENVANIVENIGRQKDVEEKIIDPAVQETIKATTALFPVADVIKERPKLKEKIEELLSERIAGYGVILEEVSIKNITFSEQFTDAIEKKQVAEQQRAQAEFEAQAVVAKAEGKAQEQVLLRESLTPDVLKRLWIERWDGKLPTIVSDGNMIYQLP